MKTNTSLLTITFDVYDQNDTQLSEGNIFNTSYFGELPPNILKAAINQINTEVKRLDGYWLITEINTEEQTGIL